MAWSPIGEDGVRGGGVWWWWMVIVVGDGGADSG